MKLLKVFMLLLLLTSGCTIVSANRTFPKFDWYWSRDAKIQRESEHNK